MNGTDQAAADVLRIIRVRGVASIDDIARGAGISLEDAAAVLDRLVADGAIVARQGALCGFGLTGSGRRLGERLLATAVDAAGARSALREAHRAFDEINPRLLGVCAAWQTRPTADGSVRNDHSDPTYDATIRHRLGAVHRAALPMLDALAAALPRLSQYRDRLTHALGRVEAGEDEWFCGVRCDSYHAVWFELHEDLLATLGLERSDVVASPPSVALTGSGI